MGKLNGQASDGNNLLMTYSVDGNGVGWRGVTGSGRAFPISRLWNPGLGCVDRAGSFITLRKKSKSTGIIISSAIDILTRQKMSTQSGLHLLKFSMNRHLFAVCVHFKLDLQLSRIRNDNVNFGTIPRAFLAVLCIYR